MKLVSRRKALKNTISGNKILAYVTNYKNIDINTLEDFKKNI